ncbi:MAG: antibiotic biosynthesis monooxygenase [Acidimicrobiales bacterium]|nr:antibiotic biosynthesis monooxygenase [Acidimicrobiales bacterium]
MTTTPEPPYYAVVFTNRRAGWGDEGVDAAYNAAAARMEDLASTIPGYLGIESARSGDGTGITVSYWASEDAIAEWRRHPEHLDVQAHGRSDWYEWYELRVGRVERARSFP